MTKIHLTTKEWELLRLLAGNNGLYDAEDQNGNRIGKLVGYAGTYETPEGNKQYVGTRYWNVPRGAERNPEVMRAFIHDLRQLMHDSVYSRGQPLEIQCAFGCPEGGIIPAYELARESGWFFSRADKKVIELATPHSREKSKLVFGRHTVEPGWNVAIVDDVGNNFSTTAQAIELVESAGARVVVIIYLVNRSPEGINEFIYEGREIEILSAVMTPTLEYRQDDPAVADDVKAGNIVWKPKNEWDELVSSITPTF